MEWYKYTSNWIFPWSLERGCSSMKYDECAWWWLLLSGCHMAWWQLEHDCKNLQRYLIIIIDIGLSARPAYAYALRARLFSWSPRGGSSSMKYDECGHDAVPAWWQLEQDCKQNQRSLIILLYIGQSARPAYAYAPQARLFSWSPRRGLQQHGLMTTGTKLQKPTAIPHHDYLTSNLFTHL